MILLFILLLYYWYFYTYVFQSKPIVTKPISSGPISPQNPVTFQFHSMTSNQFHFMSHGQVSWDHTLLDDTAYRVQNDKIVSIDACHGIPDKQVVLATGKPLYDYLILNPQYTNTFQFKDTTPFTIQKGNVFHFKCLKGRIDTLHICPSGTTFLRNMCRPINSCTDQSEGTLFNHPTVGSKYIECQKEKEMVRDCPYQHIFHHNRCERVQNLNHYCKSHPFPDPFHYDAMTRVECRNQKPVYIKCKPGTRFFDKEYCEPDTCHGLPDGTAVPLPEQKIHPFRFVPGYMTCRDGRIDHWVHCPQNWDALYATDNLTFLPMVYQAGHCSIPQFCTNVFSNDSDVIVPGYHFAKHVQNWTFSDFLDRTVGHTCENNVRKRKMLSPGEVISKRFKIESACGPFQKLLIYEDSRRFYDCATHQVQDCPPSTFFNGSNCDPLPQDAFYFENFPLFSFDSLNSEFWIKPWDYSNESKRICQEPESHHIKMYNICSHPDCSSYGFVSQIPEFEVLLPREKRAKCKYDEKEKWIQKESVHFDYDFWEQRRVDPREDDEEDEEEGFCVPGQRIQTGNFIWDRTVFATCQLEQPFLFCPSTHTFDIFLADEEKNVYACQPPGLTRYYLDSPDWTLYDTNEIKRIVPATDKPTSIQRSKGKPMELLPPTGVFITEDVRVNLAMTEPVFIEPRYRVTYPPNVAIHYKTDPYDVKTATSDYSFLVKLKNFTDKFLRFPRYKPIKYVELFKESLDV